MQVEYTGRQVEVGTELRALAEKKLGKLAKVLPGITHVHVILTADKHRMLAEVSVHSPHLDLAATVESGDLASSLSTVMDKLARQAQRHLGKWRERKRRSPARATGLWTGVMKPPPAPAGEEDDHRPRVIRSRLMLMKPMTVEEALLEVDQSEDGLLVFREARTDRMHVLYRRKDGNLGLIEPEA